MAGPNWVNRTIWTGDNLHILRGMNSESVDLIYLDPPFNSNRNYAAPIGSKAAGAAFKDTWTLSDLDDAWLGLIADVEPALYQVVHAAGLAHGKGMQSYLCMMAVRLTEMRRVLKPTGSIYLHCDPTASHYLKTLMDVVFGRLNFRNEITWQRHTSLAKGSQHGHKSWGTTTDCIIYYASPPSMLKPYRQLTTEERIEQFPLVSDKGERYYDDSSHVFRSPGMGERPNLCYEWRGFANPSPAGWRLSRERLEQEYHKGNIVITENGLERRKYERDYVGKLVGNLWTDIPLPLGNERIGYPTQKPLALLGRIIEASSNEGDVVLDPFCGCATACVAAEMHGRQWAGIDLSEKAVELVTHRLRDHHGLFGEVIPRTDIPKQEDRLDVIDIKRERKHILFGQQEGVCKGCKYSFEFRHFEIDHVVPTSKGGPDHIENLQLLCGHCNKIKGNRPMEYLMARLNENEYLSTQTARP